MATIAQYVGMQIRLLRQQRDLTQEALAARAGLHTNYIGQVERAERVPTVTTLDKIVQALGISYAEFFSVIDTPNSSPALPFLCYTLISEKSAADQERIYRILRELDQLGQ